MESIEGKRGKIRVFEAGIEIARLCARRGSVLGDSICISDSLPHRMSYVYVSHYVANCASWSNVDRPRCGAHSDGRQMGPRSWSTTRQLKLIFRRFILVGVHDGGMYTSVSALSLKSFASRKFFLFSFLFSLGDEKKNRCHEASRDILWTFRWSDPPSDGVSTLVPLDYSNRAIKKVDG